MSATCNNYKDVIYEHIYNTASAPGFFGRDRSVIQDVKKFISSDEFRSNYFTSEDGIKTKASQREFAQFIVDVLQEFFINVGNPQDMVDTIVDQWLNSDTFKLGNRESTSSEKLVQLNDEEMYKLQYNQDYMRDAFGGSNKTLLDAKRQAKKMLTRAFIYSSNGIVSTNTELREAIMREQQALLDTVLDYLREEFSSDPRVTERGQYVLNRFYRMFHDNGEYTNVIEMIEQSFGQAFEKPDNLFELQVKADGARGFKPNDNAKRFIEAYKSWTLLKNFSSLVKDTFGDAVEVDEDLNEYDPNRYSIGKAGSNVYTTWRTSDEIFLSDELNNIVQLIVTSAPMYGYGIDTPLEDSELRLNDFNYIIGKLKNFSGTVQASDTSKFRAMKNKVTNLSQETTKAISTIRSLSELIDKIRTNPSKYLPAVFEILSNPDAYSELIRESKSSDIRLGGFNNHDKNLIYTLYKNFFDRTNPESLIRNQERTSRIEKDYYGYLTQVIDSVYTNKYLQYYRDVNGNMRIRGMMGQQLDDIRIRLERSIQSKHARGSIVYSDYAKKYSISPTVQNSDTTQKIQKVEFTIPLYTLDGTGYKVSKGLKLHVIVGNNNVKSAFNETVKYEVVNSNGEIINLNSEDLFKNAGHFIEDMIGLDVNNDKFIKAFQAASQQKGENFDKLTKDLINFSSRILFRIYLSSNQMLDAKGEYIKTKDEARQKIKDIYRNNSMNPNSYIYPATGEVKLVSGDDLQTLKTLAATYAYIRNLATASIVKDGNGNSLSADSLSKLGSAYRTQWVEQNKKYDSASRDYILLDPELFMGLFQAKELKDYEQTQSKSHVDFNPTEMLDGTLIYDYLTNITSQDGAEDHNTVFFLASVNSDKSNIGRLKINLNYNPSKLFKEELSEINDFLNQIQSYLPQELKYTATSVKQFNNACAKLNLSAQSVIEDAIRRFILDKKYEIQMPSSNNFKFDENGQLVINENIIVGENTTLAELIKQPNGEQVFRNIIRVQLGAFYNNVIANMNADLEKLNGILPPNYPKLSYDQISYAAFNLWCKQQRLVPVDVINTYVAKHNYENPNDIITLTDQMHFINDGGDLDINKTLIELNKILNSQDLTDQYFDNANNQVFEQLIKDDFQIETNNENVNFDSLYTEKQRDTWINKQNGKLVLGIITYTTPDGKVKTRRVTSNVDLIPVAKDLGLQENATLKDIKEASTEFAITLNPQIAKYNALNYLFTQEWLSSTVGTHMAHPSKAKFAPGEYNFIEDEASRFNAQHKRNVSFTASMHEFQLNLLNGIPSEYNVAVIREITDELYNIMGITDKSVSPYDGATFVNPFIVYLENYSLGGAKAGVNKKQFVHYYDERTGNGGIIKTAGFGLTNLLISDSPQMKIMMHNMTGRKWRLKNGEPFVGNIFETYNRNPIYIGRTVEGGYKLGDIYYKDNQGRIVKVVGINHVGGNQYTIDTCYVTNENVEGVVIPGKEPITIESNWDLWRLFGGEKSVEYDLKQGKFVQSENSIKYVVDMMNRVGQRTEGAQNIQTQEDVYQFMKHSDVHYMPVEGSVKQGAANMNDARMWSTDDPESLNFMKVKMNQAGIQLDKEHNADSEEVSLMTQVISACAQRGYTLDKSTKMYQALASLARVGLKDQLSELSKLYQLGEDGTDEEFEDQKTNFQETVVNLVFDSLIHQAETQDLVSKIAHRFVQEAKLGKKIQFRTTPDSQGLDQALPYSIDEIYKKTHSIINVALTKSAIKVKLPGLLSILCPSFDIMKIYNGKLYHEYDDPETELAALQEQQKPVWSINLDGIEPVSYKAGNVKEGSLASSNPTEGVKLAKEEYTVDEYMDYIFSRGQYANNETAEQKREVFRQIQDDEQIEGDLETFLRNLIQTPEDVKFILIHHEASHLRNNDIANYFEGDVKGQPINWMHPRKIAIEKRATMDALHRLIRYKENNADQGGIEQISLGRTYRIVRDDGSVETKLINTPLDYYELKSQLGGPFKHVGEQIIPGIVSVTEDITVGRNLGHYNVYFKASDGKTYNIYDLDSVKACYQLEAQKLDATEARRSMQRDMFKLHKREGSVLIDGNIVDIAEIIEERPYEVIMPKTAKTDFGLDTGDNLSEIIANKDFFTNKILSNYKSRISSINSDVYDIELKRLNGDHLYVLSADRLDDLLNDPDFGPDVLQRRKIEKLVIDGEVWRMNPVTKERMYKLSPREDINDDSYDDKVYTFNDGTEKIEIIVTNNIGHYLGTQTYLQAAISPNLQLGVKPGYRKQFDKLKNLIQSCAEEGSPYYNESLQNQLDGLEGETFEGLNQQINTLSSASDLNNPSIKYIANKIKRNGNQIYASFMKSLEIIAARIPAQSMQSFMPMKIVGFDNSDRNTAYVSTAQIWLQGSDYDIDAVTLTNFSFDKTGKYITWSPLASISSFEALKASDNIPFPNGKSILMLNAENQHKVDVPELKISAYDFVDRKSGRALTSPRAIAKWAELIEHINNYGTKGIVLEEGIAQIDLARMYNYVDRHNAYIRELHNKGGRVLEGAVKNFMVTQMFNISIDPVNLQASQHPVDVSTKPFKSRANQRTDVVEEQKQSTPASFVNAIHSIYENQVGKTGVGICAVGLKSYFATTQATNQIIEDGTNREKVRSLLGKNGEGVTIRGKLYKAFSNIYKYGADPFEQISQEEIAFRTNLKNDVDAIHNRNVKELEIFLGHTPNEEELETAGFTLESALQAAKQYYAEEYPENKNILDRIQTYSDIDADIKLAEIDNDNDAAVALSALLSLATDNAKELALAKMNAGTGMLGMYIYGIAIGIDFDTIFEILTSPAALEISKLMRGNAFNDDPALAIGQVFNYVDKGPGVQLQTFLRKNSNGGIAITNLVIALAKELGRENKVLYNERGLSELLVSLSNIDLLEKLRNTQFKDSVIGNKLIDLCENYVKISNIIRNDPNYDDIKTLSKGAEEYRVLGQILHINQGLYTSIPDSLNYLNVFQNLISNETNSDKDKIDILKFAMDEEYREFVIDEYENKAKNTINVLQVASKVPHFLQYLQIAALSDAMMDNISAKYRATKVFAEDMIETYKVKSSDAKKAMYRSMDTMVNALMINDWLLDTNKTITIKKGNQYYIEQGRSLKLKEAKSDMTIRLGTDSGNATFKHWMETVVIPELKKGMTHFDGNKRRVSIRDNQFIQDLTLNIYQNTPNYNVIYAYTLPINMSPRSDEEVALFDTYKSEFMKLNNNDIGYYYMNKKSNGDPNPIRIIDLFFLYQAIVTQDKAGESNLHSLFGDMQDAAIVKEFYAYVNEFDRNGDISLSRVPREYIKRFAIPKINPRNSLSEEIVFQDPNYFGNSIFTLTNEIPEGENVRVYPSKDPKQVYIESRKIEYSQDQVVPYNTSGNRKFVVETNDGPVNVEYSFRQGRLHNSEVVSKDVTESYTDSEGKTKTKRVEVAALVKDADGTMYAIKTYGERSTQPFQIAEVIMKKPGSDTWEEVTYRIRDGKGYRTVNSREYYRMRKKEEIKIPISKRTKEVDTEKLWDQINNIIHKC